jgi:hypothetical protein
MLSDVEERILASIVVASDNDPQRPEFPADDPKFPATPTVKVDFPGYTNVWVKDESYNPTGTHKDRMAWEIVVTYRDFLLAKQRGQMESALPQMSIISSGSAAIAIQTQLKKYGLPNLKVLADSTLPDRLKESMYALGCELYFVDLSKRAFTWADILSLTNNPDGFDVTSSDALDPTTRFYDWLSYEVLNSSPEYCFVPFGTGNLFENILNINKREVSSAQHDPRFAGDVEVLRRCNFLGATTSNSASQADKLYSPHLPFAHFNEQWLNLYRFAGFCGAQSGVHSIREDVLQEAVQMAEGWGIACEPSGIAGLALFLQMKEHVPRDAKVVILSTGKLTTFVTP